MSAIEGGDALKLHIVPVIIPVSGLAKNADEKHTEMKQSQGSLTLEQIWKVTTPPTTATVEEKKARPLSSFNNRHSLETEALLGENRAPKPSLGDRIINFLEGFFKVAKIKYE